MARVAPAPTIARRRRQPPVPRHPRGFGGATGKNLARLGITADAAPEQKIKTDTAQARGKPHHEPGPPGHGARAIKMKSTIPASTSARAIKIITARPAL